MQKVFANQPLFHHWAHNPMDDIRNSGGSLFTQDGILYSYGTHYKMAKQYHRPFDGAAIVTLFNEDTYSPTTGKQRGQAMSACSHHVVWLVPDVDPSNLDAHRENAIWLHEQVTTAIASIKRSRKYKAQAASSAIRCCQTLLAYMRFFEVDLPAELSVEFPELADAEALIEEAERADRMAQEALEATMLDDLRDWAQGKREQPPASAYRVAPRLRVHNGEFQTSHGIRFTLTDAIREELAVVWQLVQDYRAGRFGECTYNMSDHKVGSWCMNKIETTEDRTYLVAGCHRMAYPQIRRVARMLGFKQTAPALAVVA